MDSRSPEDCDRFLAFCAEPRFPSREKPATRRPLGDLSGLGEVRLPWSWPFPFVMSVKWFSGISIWNLSLDMEKCCRPPPVAEVGEPSGEELDIAAAPDGRAESRQSCSSMLGLGDG